MGAGHGATGRRPRPAMQPGAGGGGRRLGGGYPPGGDAPAADPEGRAGAGGACGCRFRRIMSALASPVLPPPALGRAAAAAEAPARRRCGAPRSRGGRGSARQWWAAGRQECRLPDGAGGLGW